MVVLVDAHVVAGDAREEAVQWIIGREPADVRPVHRCDDPSLGVGEGAVRSGANVAGELWADPG